MLTLSPVHLNLPQAQEVEIQAEGYRFSATLWYAVTLGWLANIRFDIGEDITIHRRIPVAMSEVDAAAWIQQSYREGPSFLLPLLEDTP